MKTTAAPPSVIAAAALFTGAVVVLGYVLLGLWPALLFAFGFVGGLVLWLAIPARPSFTAIRAPYFVALALFVIHKAEERYLDFLSGPLTADWGSHAGHRVGLGLCPLRLRRRLVAHSLAGQAGLTICLFPGMDPLRFYGLDGAGALPVPLPDDRAARLHPGSGQRRLAGPGGLVGAVADGAGRQRPSVWGWRRGRGSVRASITRQSADLALGAALQHPGQLALKGGQLADLGLDRVQLGAGDRIDLAAGHVRLVGEVEQVRRSAISKPRSRACRMKASRRSSAASYNRRPLSVRRRLGQQAGLLVEADGRDLDAGPARQFADSDHGQNSRLIL